MPDRRISLSLSAYVVSNRYQICLPPPATDPAALPRRIGDFGLHPTGDPKDRRMKVAILISKEEKGKGYGREAIMYAMGAAFNVSRVDVHSWHRPGWG